MNKLYFNDGVIAEAKTFNRKLAYAPRFKIRNRLVPRIGQLLLQLSQNIGFRKLPDVGLHVEKMMAEIEGHQVPVRIIRPSGMVKAVLFDIHGGGWVIGNARMNDQQNATMIANCDVAVVSVDYRLALDVPIHTIIEDCVIAARWLLEDRLSGYAGLPVIFVGESAGGYLAAATLLRLKAWPQLLQRVAGAVLYYGVYDLAGTPSVRSAGPETLVLHGPSMVSGLAQLTPNMSDAERRDPTLSPLYGDLHGLPPALMFVGEIDPLRDDTLEMAKRWSQAASVEEHLLPEAAHGFIHFPTRMAEQVIGYVCSWINQQIAQDSYRSPSV